MTSVPAPLVDSTAERRVLVADDDPTIRTFVAAHLRARGYRVDVARDGREALDKAALTPPDAVVLDLVMPEIDGAGFLGRFREWSAAPVLVLSALGEERRKVGALDAGADDYLTKPFSMEELLARLRTLLRRAHQAPVHVPGTPAIVAGDLRIDLGAQIVTRAGQEVPLTRTEYALLRELATNADKILTHRHLLQRVWGSEYGEETEYLRTFVRQLRKKLEPDPARPVYLLTQPGVGYRFHLPAAA
jgi:two-component system, OmpR family, KDP operon response regulator KdpE